MCAALVVLALFFRAVPATEPPSGFVIKDFSFQPAELTVQAGTRVTWMNQDEEVHTVVSDSGLFRSAALDTGESFSFKFDKPGTYHFTCSLHSKMAGTVIVH
jgi:plastocyanin